jgi:hypothetical protein
MKDPILEVLMKSAEALENGKGPKDQSGAIQITLAVGGMLVSGRIVSYNLYMQLLHDGVLQEVVDKAKADGKLSPSTELDNSTGEYIHLAGAKFLLGEGHSVPSTGEPVLWRGRVDRVDGFNTGEIVSGPVPT